jgi:hypothetical protein
LVAADERRRRCEMEELTEDEDVNVDGEDARAVDMVTERSKDRSVRSSLGWNYFGEISDAAEGD